MQFFRHFLKPFQNGRPQLKVFQAAAAASKQQVYGNFHNFHMFPNSLSVSTKRGRQNFPPLASCEKSSFVTMSSEPGVSSKGIISCLDGLFFSQLFPVFLIQVGHRLAWKKWRKNEKMEEVSRQEDANLISCSRSFIIVFRATPEAASRTHAQASPAHEVPLKG